MKTASYNCVIVVMLIALCPRAHAGQLSKAWRTVYRALNGDKEPPWVSSEDAEAWALTEKERVEPFVLDILRGQHDDTKWTSALPIARIIPTAEVRDVLLDRTTALVAQHPGNLFVAGSPDIGALSLLLEILSVAKDVRVVPIVQDLVMVQNQPGKVVEDCVHVLRRIGGEEALAKIRSVKQRAETTRIQAQCSLAEKIVQSKLKGNDIFKDAQVELTVLLTAYVEAVEQKDYEAYKRTLAMGASGALQKTRVEARIFQNEKTTPFVENIHEALDDNKPFQVDEDFLTARIFVGDGYALNCLLENGGWKIDYMTWAKK